MEQAKKLQDAETKLNTKNRVIYYDILNILACISVVILHSNGIVHFYSDMRAWKTALIFEVICYWAVPVFIMLSGGTLLKYRERYSTKEFFKRRFVKVLIPWIIWSLIIFVINKKSFNFMQFVSDFAYGEIESAYWFFPLILFLYCIIPVLSVFTEKEEYRKILKAILAFLFVFKAVINPICLIFNIELPTIFSFCLEPSGYIMFLILGYLLSTTNISKNKRIVVYILGILSIFIRYFYTYFMSEQAGKLNTDLFDYCSAVSVLLAIAVFVFVKNVKWEKIINKLHIKPNFLAGLSACSFGVYLIHKLIRDQVTTVFNLDMHSIWYRTVGAILLYIISVIIVYIIKKIPILKKIVP